MSKDEQRTPLRLLTDAIGRVLQSGDNAVLATALDGAFAGAKLLVESQGPNVGSLGSEAADELVARYVLEFFAGSHKRTSVVDLKTLSNDLHGSVMLERIEPEPGLVICGAGHVGAALAELANTLGYRVTLIDDRAEFLTPERFGDSRIELIKADDWSVSVRAAIGSGKGVSVAIVTRGHNEDEECLQAVLTVQPEYVGLIGSKRRTNIVLERLRVAGVDEKRLLRVRAPVGLDLGAVTPEEVALAILAEVVAERRGGKGGSLSAWRRVE